MPIFQDEGGFAIKFFIQKDLPENVQAELCDTITSLGGRVEAKVPRQGYVLIQPNSSEAERLRLCWRSEDRPERYFVPFTYVEACKVAGILLKQLFVEDGEPIKMHIHSSIANPNARAALSQRIMHSGGDPTASMQTAKVVLADPNTEVFRNLVKVNQSSTDQQHIESYLWVKKCVEKNSIVYTPLVYKNPGGRRAGEERTQFTDEDEEHLCKWIATKIPFKQTGGRTGNRLYQQLCDMGNDPEFAWVKRHTWQSWRERYKKNAARLDIRIQAIVDLKKPAQGEQGQYGYVRQPEKPKRPRRKRGSKNAEAEVTQTLEDDPSHDEDLFTLGNDASAEEEMDDNEDDPEWAVRIGNAPPPAWAKRRASGEHPEASPSKRVRETGPSNNNANGEQVHFVDRILQQIAEETKFTVEEVTEYYDRFGEMERTRARFQKMRELLRKSFPDNE
ncbi:hypothetical protein ONZ45_g7298 [Pleurotus djamor]|nr:hypothetical protein ONZ45_g7298 [Pleurotus djamor]